METKLELDMACERLRIVIRNKQQAKDYKDAWRHMSLESSAKRRLLKEQSRRRK